MKNIIPYFLSFIIHLLVIFAIFFGANRKNRMITDNPIIIDVITTNGDKNLKFSNLMKNLKQVSIHRRVSAGAILAKKGAKIVQPKGNGDYDSHSKITKDGFTRKNVVVAAAKVQKKEKRRLSNNKTAKNKTKTVDVASINHGSILKSSVVASTKSKPFHSNFVKGIRNGSGSFKKEAVVSIGTKDYKYASYMAHIKRQVESVWVYPEEAIEKGESGVLFLFFIINKDGSLYKTKLLSSSGYKILDDAAANALTDAAPFPPLPKRLNIDRLKIYASFRYNISFDTDIN